MDQDARYEAARKRLEEIKGFYMHLGISLVIGISLFAINQIATPDRLWFHWPVLILGATVAIHGFVMAVENKFFGPEWEDRKMRDWWAPTT